MNANTDPSIVDHSSRDRLAVILSVAPSRRHPRLIDKDFTTTRILYVVARIRNELTNERQDRTLCRC